MPTNNNKKNKLSNYTVDCYAKPKQTTDKYIIEKSQNHYEKWKCPHTKDYKS